MEKASQTRHAEPAIFSVACRPTVGSVAPTASARRLGHLRPGPVCIGDRAADRREPPLSGGWTDGDQVGHTIAGVPPPVGFEPSDEIVRHEIGEERARVDAAPACGHDGGGSKVVLAELGYPSIPSVLPWHPSERLTLRGFPLGYATDQARPIRVGHAAEICAFCTPVRCGPGRVLNLTHGPGLPTQLVATCHQHGFATLSRGRPFVHDHERGLGMYRVHVHPVTRKQIRHKGQFGLVCTGCPPTRVRCHLLGHAARIRVSRDPRSATPIRPQEWVVVRVQPCPIGCIPVVPRHRTDHLGLIKRIACHPRVTAHEPGRIACRKHAQLFTSTPRTHGATYVVAGQWITPVGRDQASRFPP